MVDEKHPEDVADRKMSWFKDRGMTVPAADNEPNDNTATLAEDASGDIEILAEHYDLAELTSENFALADEIGTLEQRIEALSGRTPRYVQTLSERLLALESARPALENEYADVSSWESLEKNGDFD